jgi:hypothetical protein
MIEKILGPIRDDKNMTLNLTDLARLARCEEGHPMDNYYAAGPYFLPCAALIHDTPDTGRFQFLPYIKGKITVVRQADVDVLSGPMSGCWLIMFRWRNSQFVAHVGTDMEDGIGNFWTKVTWNDFVDKNAGSVEVIAGFNPFANWCTSPGYLSVQPAQKGDNQSKVFGLFTPNRELYSIHTYDRMREENLYRIAGVIKARNGLLRGKYIQV